MRVPLLVIAFASCSAPVTVPLDAAPQPVTAADLLRATSALTDIGPRSSGTPGEALARQIVVDALSETGLDVTEHSFVWSPWVPGEASVQVGDAFWSAEPLSPSPPTSGLTLSLARGGSEVSGQAALWFSDDASRAEQYLAGVAAGAQAMIRVTEDLDHDGTPLIEVGHTWSLASTPAVTVNRDVGAELEDLLGEPVTIEITSSTIPNHESRNVVARIPGATDDEVYVTAHYDSWHNSECAADNALGVGMLILLSEVFATTEPERSIVLLATTGEEQGLRGASAWVADHAPGLGARGELLVNLDIPWSSEGRYFCQSDHQEWMDAAINSAASVGLTAADAGAPWPASDHFVFQPHGVPVVWCTRQPDRHYHTEADTLDWIDMDEAFVAFTAQAQLIAQAAGVHFDSLPWEADSP